MKPPTPEQINAIRQLRHNEARRAGKVFNVDT